MIVYKTTDQVPVKIGDLTFWISPLTHRQKLEMVSIANRSGGQETANLMEQSFLCVRYSVKAVDGLKNPDGTDYKLELSEGIMTEECLDELLQLEIRQKVVDACLKLAPGIQDVKIPGVKIDLKGIRSLKKK